MVLLKIVFYHFNSTCLKLQGGQEKNVLSIQAAG